jgi:hypothetical protein
MSIAPSKLTSQAAWVKVKRSVCLEMTLNNITQIFLANIFQHV